MNLRSIAATALMTPSLACVTSLQAGSASRSTCTTPRQTCATGTRVGGGDGESNYSLEVAFATNCKPAGVGCG